MVATIEKKSTSLPYFAGFLPAAGLLPAEITIRRGEEKTLVFSKLQNALVRVEEGAKLIFVLVATEGWAELAQITFELTGREAEVKFLGFIVGAQDHKFPFETISRHLVPQTKAHYYLKAAMFGSSIVDYKGNIMIAKEAQLTDSYLAHNTLLLSPQARARTIPALEIEADDVKAGHAATIGKVDDELMFYLTSRGISPKEAEEMLIQGFFADYLRMIPDEKLRGQIGEFLEQSIPT